MQFLDFHYGAVASNAPSRMLVYSLHVYVSYISMSSVPIMYVPVIFVHLSFLSVSVVYYAIEKCPLHENGMQLIFALLRY